jgi:hypothetical protein
MRRGGGEAGRSGAIALALAGAAIVFTSCNITLFAPQGSGIVLTPSATTMTPDGSITITATVTENARQSSTALTTPGQNQQTSTFVGPFVHNGTVVDFVTTIGRIDPAESFTTDGKVTVTLTGTGEAGTATITAASGNITKTLTITIAEPSGSSGPN